MADYFLIRKTKSGNECLLLLPLSSLTSELLARGKNTDTEICVGAEDRKDKMA